MKRRHFLKLSAVAGAAAPLAALAQPKPKKAFRVPKGFKVGAGNDRTNKPLSLFEGDTFFTKVSDADTDGDIFMFESTRIKNGGPFEHFHYDQDEWWYVLEGEFLVRIGDETFPLKKGDSVFGPRMVKHAWAKTGDGAGRLLMFFQPAGKMEAYFKAVSEGALKGLSPAALDAFVKAHGFERTGPALTILKQ